MGNSRFPHSTISHQGVKLNHVSAAMPFGTLHEFYGKFLLNESDVAFHSTTQIAKPFALRNS
jgi:hypothetical protein